MINRKHLLKDLKPLLKRLEDDILERSESAEDVLQHVRSQYDSARAGGRTGLAFSQWRDDYITQSAVAWILACVFVRFVEDNELIDRFFISGAGKTLSRVKDDRLQFFKDNPTLTDREYLEFTFETVGRFPAMGSLFDKRYNPLYLIAPSGDGAKELLAFFQRVDEKTGHLVHDFTDSALETRFLGDLYQDLSDDAKTKFALLQTPDFVEEFILSKTLEPAIAEFGYRDFRIIDPTCGSGHLLLGSFRIILRHLHCNEPGTSVREMVKIALDSVYGVDVNPSATSIAKFRLLVEAVKACGLSKLKDTPAFVINVATGDSLLHGSRPGQISSRQQYLDPNDDPLEYVYETEDSEQLRRILGQQYHAVVGNPPYITVKDKVLNQAYRDRYGSCYKKYSLAAPFMERFFELGLEERGYIGMITTNSFMKREFGKKLIKEYMPKWELTHIINTAGAFIPGHGTPTVILFGRNRAPIRKKVRAVFEIRPEPSTPADPAKGHVWTEIIENLECPGFEGEYVSVADQDSDHFHQHPWNLSGGGASELKILIEEQSTWRLKHYLEKGIGPACFPGIDDAFVGSRAFFQRNGIPDELIFNFTTGEQIRDWLIFPEDCALTPYDTDARLLEFDRESAWGKYLWRFRHLLESVVSFDGKTRKECGEKWWGWYRWIERRVSRHPKISFSFIGSHNHFALDVGGNVFNRSAPVVILNDDVTDEFRLSLLALLNSSIACFWMKQVSQQKQLTAGDSIRIASHAKVPYEFSGTQLEEFPLPHGFEEHKLRSRLSRLAGKAVELGEEFYKLEPGLALRKSINSSDITVSKALGEVNSRSKELLSQLVQVQEEIDFTVYSMYGLAGNDLLNLEGELMVDPVQPGMRPFEILKQYSEDDFEVPVGVPTDWSAEICELWRRRMNAAQEIRELRVVEESRYKRRWIGRQGKFNRVSNVDELMRACEQWLLNEIERMDCWKSGRLMSCGQISELLCRDEKVLKVIEHLRGTGSNLSIVIEKLVTSESVPGHSALRYKESGLRKRKVWEEIWELQRIQDGFADPMAEVSRSTTDKLYHDFPAAPKYKSSDMKNGSIWSLRGKFDIPRERFVSFPHCGRDSDSTLLVGWAGWNHQQRAKAVANYYTEMMSNEGWSDERLVPLLAYLLELIPWLKQWHNDLDPEFNLAMGDFYQSFVEQQARELGKTVEEIKSWNPPKTSQRKRRSK